MSTIARGAEILHQRDEVLPQPFLFDTCNNDLGFSDTAETLGVQRKSEFTRRVECLLCVMHAHFNTTSASLQGPPFLSKGEGAHYKFNRVQLAHRFPLLASVGPLHQNRECVFRPR